MAWHDQEDCAEAQAISPGRELAKSLEHSLKDAMAGIERARSEIDAWTPVAAACKAALVALNEDRKCASTEDSYV